MLHSFPGGKYVSSFKSIFTDHTVFQNEIWLRKFCSCHCLSGNCFANRKKECLSSVTPLGGACFLLKCKCIKTIQCKGNHLTLPYFRSDGRLPRCHQGNQTNNISLMSAPMFAYFTGGLESFFMVLCKSWLFGMMTDKKLTRSFIHSHILEIRCSYRGTMMNNK